MKKTVCALVVCFCVYTLQAQKKVSVASPDGNITFTLKIATDHPTYRISYKKTTLIENAAIGFDFDSGEWGKNLTAGKAVYKEIDETYELVVGKVKKARSRCNEVVIPLEEKTGIKRKINFIVRVFDDGLAFRYEFPEQNPWKSYVMYDELTTFNMAGNPKVLALFMQGYINAHEGLYTYTNYDALQPNKLMDMPTTFVFPDPVYLSITEAALLDYAGLYLVKEGDRLTGKLSPHLGQMKTKVKADLPHRTPWRVFMISDRIETIMESNILTHLNDPCKIEDTSWIKPGKTTFPWWNGNMVPDTTFSPGNNFLTNKYYIDFASRNGLDFHSIYGYAEQAWYTDDGLNFGWPGPNVDITRPIATLNMHEICRYAKSRRVDIHVWVHWKALYPQIDEAFARFQDWGIVGMMVDFMDRDDQEMIRIQEEILVKAAKHHLFIQFHGSSKPSGLHRTYPNEFTREGTLNYEVYKWDTIVNANHDIHMPFSRALAGPADYHLGGFRAVQASQFKIQYTHPMVTGTRCHMLGMYIVLESYLAMVCDTPPSYEGQAGWDFLRRLPTTWDETKVPEALINEYAIVARRKGNDWYIGAINNSNARTVHLPLKMLAAGNYQMELYTDSEDAGIHPNHLEKQVKTVSHQDIIALPLASGGGAVMRISPR